MMRSLLANVSRSWYVYLVLLVIWFIAVIRILVDPTPLLPILFNVTPSLPYRFVIVDYSARDLRRGDYVIYAFEGAAVQQFPGLRRQPFFKRIAGVAGDVVSVSERHVYVNGVDVGYARPRTTTRLPLAPIDPVVIPRDHFYVAGLSPESFDSRYAISGLVARRQILGRAKPLW